MADVCDLADIEIERIGRAALSAVLSKKDDPQDIDEAGRVWCLDCGSQLHDDRLAAWPLASRCVPCATINETRLKFYASGATDGR